MQIPYSYDSAAITAQCWVADRLRAVAREQWIAMASQPSAPRLIAAVGRRCIQAGAWLQSLGQPTKPTMPTFAEEQVS
jgi:hypothetical protein